MRHDAAARVLNPAPLKTPRRWRNPNRLYPRCWAAERWVL